MHTGKYLALMIWFFLGCTIATAAPTDTKPPATPQCNGTFSNGVMIKPTAAVYMADVGYIDQKTPVIKVNSQTVCDVHTFAWNQFLYMTQNDPKAAKPRFMQLAPWYNTLTTGAKPGPYPGGPTDLRTSFLDQTQAGDDNKLLDVAGNLVRYDIRFDINMYQSIVLQNYYSEAGYKAACNPDPKNQGVCLNNLKMWMSPSGANEHPEPGSIEMKTSWRDFGTAAACPSAHFYCEGRFGLIGLHYVNKTFSHGEWVWASFEHIANTPDCAPGGDAPIAAKSPINSSWSFFDPSKAPASVMASKRCNVTSNPPQCNANPNPSGDKKTWQQVNVCRTYQIPAGGASAANCAVGSTPNSEGNVACLNASILGKRTGAWKNYRLIGAVWTAGGMGPNQDFRIKGFQTQVQGIPFATPVGFVHLANTTMETWLQRGATGYDPFKTNASQSGCFLCHNQPSAFGAAGRQVDLSHFPGKLPVLKMEGLKKALVPAH